MKTFVLDVPRELIAGQLRDRQGGLCAQGVLFQNILHADFTQSTSLAQAIDWGKELSKELGVSANWVRGLAVRNNRINSPKLRVTALKATLRELEREGHVEFLFLDEATKAEIQTREEVAV